MTKEARIYNGEKTVSLASGVGKTENSCAKKLNWTSVLHHIEKSIQDELKTQRPETIKLPEQNIEEKLLALGLVNDFLDMKAKAQITKAKIEKWDNIKLKSFCTAKETINKTERQPSEWEKIFEIGRAHV